MKRIHSAIFLGIFCLTGCATPNKHLLKVDTTPPGALVSVHTAGDVDSAVTRQIAGTTPLEKKFDFGKPGQLRLEIEKRGYAPHVEKVVCETGEVSVDLETVKDEDGKNISDYALPEINRIFLFIPDIKVIERGFSQETVSEEKSRQAREELIKGIDHYFSEKYQVINAGSSETDAQLLKPLWRDARSAMELVDPIRLRYLAKPVLLETKSSRSAANNLKDKYGTEVILIVSGKQNLETSGMKAGKIGITALGTATSYAGGYSRALARGDSFFVYNVYTPDFAEGTILKAALIDGRNGEVLWVNKGVWGRIPFDDANAIEAVITDLFTGME